MLSVTSVGLAASGVGLLSTIIAAPVAIGLQAGAIVCGLLGSGGKSVGRRLQAKARKHDLIRGLAYQKTLQYASTPLDFVFGIGLFLSPSDMALQPGNIQGYNNGIQTAGSDAPIGHRLSGINEAGPIASKGDKAFQGMIASPAGTVHKGPQPSQNKTRVSATDSDGTTADKRQKATAHEEEKRPLWPLG